MSVALRLMRFGKKGYPTYRIVALDKRSKRDGYYIEKVGLYNPMNEANRLTVDEARFNYWVGQGAVVSEGIRKLFSAKLPKQIKKVSKPKVRKGAKKAEEKPKAEKAAAPVSTPAATTEPSKPAEEPAAQPAAETAASEQPAEAAPQTPSAEAPKAEPKTE